MADIQNENSGAKWLRFQAVKPFNVKTIGLVSGPALALFIFLIVGDEPGLPHLATMSAIVTLMAVWWLTEAIPLGVTALIPLLLFPFSGLMPGREIATYYMNSTIFLFLGGFILALTMERWELHRRIAFKIIMAAGSRPDYILLGVMGAAALLSMWISNTATALMMLPILLALFGSTESGEEADNRTNVRSVEKPLLLGLAYACSIGGIATLIGTPPNLILLRIYNQEVEKGVALTFGQWMLFALPLTLVLLIIVWFLLSRVFFRLNSSTAELSSSALKELRPGAPFSYEEFMVMLVFMLTAFLWIFRQDIQIGTFEIPGWSRLLPDHGLVDDGTTAILSTLLLFLIPARKRKPGDIFYGLASPAVFKQIPWSIILLFGGGFALAAGFKKSGLTETITAAFSGVGTLHPLILILLISLAITFITELTSNTAITQLVLPVLLSLAYALKLEPLLLLLPATLSASMAFMMPIATPPNAIVFSSERLRVFDMARCGVVLNLIGALLISTTVYFLAEIVFGFTTVNSLEN